MKKRLITMIAAGALVLAACGSDSGGDASDEQPEATETPDTDEQSEATDAASDIQAEAADTLIAAAQTDDIELDADCVNDLASQLSDEDAQAIVDADGGSGAEVSAEGAAIGNQLLGCAGNDQIIDVLIEQMKASGQQFDEECVREGLEDFDIAELAASGDAESANPEEVFKAVAECIDPGS